VSSKQKFFILTRTLLRHVGPPVFLKGEELFRNIIYVEAQLKFIFFLSFFRFSFFLSFLSSFLSSFFFFLFSFFYLSIFLSGYVVTIGIKIYNVYITLPYLIEMR
jgi:hypothetical protein